MDYSSVTYDVSEGVALLTLNRPDKLNAFTVDMVAEIEDAVARAKADQGARVLMITGAGRGFCAGADVTAVAEQTPDTGGPAPLPERPTRPVGEFVISIYEFPRPTIAAVNGVAAGAGISIALACDIRIGSEAATLAAGWSALGIVPDAGASWLLPRTVGVSRACELLYTGRHLDAREALQWGLYSRVTAVEEFPSAARELAQSIASGPPVALEFTKTGIKRAADIRLPVALDFETRAQRTCFQTQDFKEGVASFRDKRAPNFQGR